MDKVQIYYCVLIGLSVLANVILNGKETSIQFGAPYLFWSTIVALPMYGRIFGWW